MAQTIFKYPLTVCDIQSLYLPKDAQILSVQVQDGRPVLWALVDEDSKKEQRIFESFGTGYQIPEGNRIYISTYQLHGGSLVLHVFEKIK